MGLITGLTFVFLRQTKIGAELPLTFILILTVASVRGDIIAQGCPEVIGLSSTTHGFESAFWFCSVFSQLDIGWMYLTEAKARKEEL